MPSPPGPVAMQGRASTPIGVPSFAPRTRLSARQGRQNAFPPRACPCQPPGRLRCRNGRGSPSGRGRPLGGEGILPSHAPQGALVRRRIRAYAPIGASEGKMPSPPGPVAMQGRAGTPIGVPSFAPRTRLSARQGRQNAFPPGTRPWQTPGRLRRRNGRGSPSGQGRPLGGEGILPSHAPQGALVRRRIRAYAPIGASEGKMPSPPGPIAMQGRASTPIGAFPWVQRADARQGRQNAFPPGTRPCQTPGRLRRRNRWGSPSGRGRPLGGEGILPSHAPQGALVRRRIRAYAPIGASEGKMPSPPGPVAMQGRASTPIGVPSFCTKGLMGR